MPSLPGMSSHTHPIGTRVIVPSRFLGGGIGTVIRVRRNRHRVILENGGLVYGPTMALLPVAED